MSEYKNGYTKGKQDYNAKKKFSECLIPSTTDEFARGYVSGWNVAKTRDELRVHEVK